MDSAIIGRAAVLGTGLIGGAILLRLRELGADVVGWDPDPDVRDLARANGVDVLDTIDEAIPHARLIFVCGPIDTVVDTVRLADKGAEGAVITDVASVKAPIVSALRLAGTRNTFVGGHPMAGSELSGLQATTPGLLRAAPWVLTLPEPRELPDFRFLCSTLLAAFDARVVPLDAARHDRAAALASHLPHLLAGTLANVTAGADVRRLVLSLAAGSFRDGTRVVGGSARRTTTIVAGNRDEVRSLRAAVLAEVNGFFDDLEKPDDGDLLRRFGTSSDLRAELAATEFTTVRASFGPDEAAAEIAWLGDVGARGGHLVTHAGPASYEALVP